MRKYNPTLDGMISNYRELATKAGLKTEHISNPDLYLIIEQTVGFSTREEEEEYFIDLIRENNRNL